MCKEQPPAAKTTTQTTLNTVLSTVKCTLIRTTSCHGDASASSPLYDRHRTARGANLGRARARPLGADRVTQVVTLKVQMFRGWIASRTTDPQSTGGSQFCLSSLEKGRFGGWGGVGGLQVNARGGGPRAQPTGTLDFINTSCLKEASDQSPGWVRRSG